MEIAEHRFTVKLLVLPICAHNVIHEMGFLSENSVIMDHHEAMLLLWSVFPEPKQSDNDIKPDSPARLHVTAITAVTARSAMLLSGEANVATGIEGVAEGSLNLLLKRGLRIFFLTLASLNKKFFT